MAEGYITIRNTALYIAGSILVLGGLKLVTLDQYKKGYENGKNSRPVSSYFGNPSKEQVNANARRYYSREISRLESMSARNSDDNALLANYVLTYNNLRQPSQETNSVSPIDIYDIPAQEETPETLEDSLTKKFHIEPKPMR